MSMAVSDDRRPGDPSERPASPGRRKLLYLALAGSFAGWLATVLYPVLRFLSSL